MKNKQIFACIAIAALTSSALAHNNDHGPFSEEATIKYVTLTELTPQSADTQSNATDHFTFVIPDDAQSQLSVVWEEDTGWYAGLSFENKTVLTNTLFSDFGCVAGIAAYTADLNQDGKADFIITSFSGGCGLASGYCNVAFLLSGSNQYTLTTLSTLNPDPTDFILIDQKPVFIHTSFHYVTACNDEKPHNFWVYNLLTFEKDTIKVSNTLHQSFPKTIWYTFKPNHTETSIITDDQKQQLLKASLQDIYWEPEANR